LKTACHVLETIVDGWKKVTSRRTGIEDFLKKVLSTPLPVVKELEELRQGRDSAPKMGKWASLSPTASAADGLSR